MANLFKHAFIDYMVACLTIVAFTTTTLTLPSKLLGTEAAIDLGKINFGIKIEKLFEKIKKSKNAIDKRNSFMLA